MNAAHILFTKSSYERDCTLVSSRYFQ